jgi:sec-independent protein translocase protein TatA
MGFGSPIHWVILGLVVLIFFGNRLPSVMRSLGQGVVEFKKGLQGIEDDIKSSGNKIEEQHVKPLVRDESKAAEPETVQR